MRILAIFTLLMLAAAPVFADDQIHLVLRDRKFSPERLEVPAGKKFQLVVKNEGDKAIEWECEELDREEVVDPGRESTIFLGPLRAGEYAYFDDRHQDSKGVLVAK